MSLLKFDREKFSIGFDHQGNFDIFKSNKTELFIGYYKIFSELNLFQSLKFYGIFRGFL